MQLPQDEDLILVEKIQSGDMAAFEEMMGRHKRHVVNFVYRMIGDAEDADEIAQDVFVRLHRNIGAYRPRRGKGGTTTKFSTWLFALAHNATVDRIRWRTRHPTDPHAHADATAESADEESESGPVAEEISKEETPSEPTPNAPRGVLDEVAAHEISEQIAAAVAKLPEEQRTAVILAEYHGMSYAEIAQVMKRSGKSVEAHLYRAKQTLRQELQFLHPEISGDAQP